MENLSTILMPHGPFAINEQRANEILAGLRLIDWKAHRAERVAILRVEAENAKHEAAAGDSGIVVRKPYEVADGVAFFTLSGVMMKQLGSWDDGTSTQALKKQIDTAVADPDVTAGFIRIDSPGGSVAGTDDLARSVAAFAKKKPMAAYIEDMGASAAYWIASQCSMVFANPTALVGSLGTYAAIVDMSGWAENEGFKVHVLSTGKYKGAGVPGSKITDEQLSQFQTNVDDLNEHFVSAVARGRGFAKTQTRVMFDGAVHEASKAKAMGLVDGVKSDVQALTALKGALASEHFDARSEYDVEAAPEPPRTVKQILSDGPAGMSLEEHSSMLLDGLDGCVKRYSQIHSQRAEEGKLTASFSDRLRNAGNTLLALADSVPQEAEAQGADAQVPLDTEFEQIKREARQRAARYGANNYEHNLPQTA